MLACKFCVLAGIEGDIGSALHRVLAYLLCVLAGTGDDTFGLRVTSICTFFLRVGGYWVGHISFACYLVLAYLFCVLKGS